MPVVAEYSIREARADEGEALREIAFDAKSHWGYDRGCVRSWVSQGDFSPGALRDRVVLVAEADGSAIGFATLIPQGHVCVLDDLWIIPAWIGRRVGSKLFDESVYRAKQLGAERLEWEAEPNAIGFYEKVGGRYLRDSDPTELGRVIPVMGIDL